MTSKTTSFQIVGFLLSVLTSTAAFAWFVRGQNLTASSNQATTVLKLAHSLDQSHPVHKAMLFMAERLQAHSAGTVSLHVSANGQLGSETECLEQLQRGALAMTKTSTIHYPDKTAFAKMVQPMQSSYDGTPVGQLLKTISELK